MRKVGILALQGATRAHARAFARLGVAVREVRRAPDLEGLTHLVLPGGESTTLHHLMQLFGLWSAIERLHTQGDLRLFGTCAGAILLARCDGVPPTFGFLDAQVVRNGFGRQLHSQALAIELVTEKRELAGLFIRAPRFLEVGPSARIIARHGEEPVALEAPGLLATSFHPELGDELVFHRRFLE